MYYYDCLLTGWLSRKPQNRFQHEKKNAQNTVASCTMGVMLTPMMPKNVNTMLFRNRNRKNQKNLAAGGGRAGQGRAGGQYVREQGAGRHVRAGRQ